MTKAESNLNQIDKTLKKYFKPGWAIGELENLIIKRLLLFAELKKEAQSKAGKMILRKLGDIREVADQVEKVVVEVRNENLNLASIETMSQLIKRLKEETEVE